MVIGQLGLLVSVEIVQSEYSMNKVEKKGLNFTGCCEPPELTITF